VIAAALVLFLAAPGAISPQEEVRRAGAILAEGHALLRAGRAQEAFAKFRAAVEAAPASPEVLLEAGKGFFALGQTTPAVDCARAVLDRDPTNPAALVLRGNARLQAREYAKAVPNFERAIGLCGGVLAEHFPPRAGNPNEVHDRLVLI